MNHKFIPNSFQIPNALVDLLMAGLSGNAVKCYLLVARQTTGWHKQMDFIPIAQFKQKCGIKKDETVAEATAQLVQFGLIEKVEQRGRVTGYRLNFVFDDDGAVPPQIGGTTTPDKRVHPKNGTTPENGGYPPPQMGGTTTPDKRGTSKYTTKNTNTKNNSGVAHDTRTPARASAEPVCADGQTETAKPAPSAKPKKSDRWAESLKLLLAEGVDEAVARDHIALRKLKGKPLTETALNLFRREAAKAGLTVAQAVQFAAEHTWITFKADWLYNQTGLRNGFTPTVRQVPKVAAGSGGAINPRTGEKIDVAIDINPDEIDF